MSDLPEEIYVGSMIDRVTKEQTYRCDIEQIGADDVKYIHADTVPQWRDIESYDIKIHPNCVLVYDRLPIPARFNSKGRRWMMGGTLLDNDNVFIAWRVNPTHWMPLPPTPKQQDKPT